MLMSIGYLGYVISLYFWTTTSGYTQETYKTSVGLLLVSGFIACLLFRKNKNVLNGCLIALVFSNLAASIACRVGVEKSTELLRDLRICVILFGFVFVIVRYTRIYQQKYLNRICMTVLPVMMLLARLTSEKVNGTYMYLGPVMLFGLILAGYACVTAYCMGGEEQRFFGCNIENLSLNKMGYLIYTFLMFACCFLCDEQGMLLVIAVTATCVFFIGCSNGKAKLVYMSLCVSGAMVLLTWKPHIRNRLLLWADWERALLNPALKGMAEFNLYLFRNLERAGFWGLGIGSTPSWKVYKTFSSDHLLITLILDYSLFLAAAVLILGVVLTGCMLNEKKCWSRYDRFFNLSAALIMGTIILIHVAGNLVSIISGITLPWAGDGTSVNLMATFLLAVHSGLMMRKEEVC